MLWLVKLLVEQVVVAGAAYLHDGSRVESQPATEAQPVAEVQP